MASKYINFSLLKSLSIAGVVATGLSGGMTLAENAGRLENEESEKNKHAVGSNGEGAEKTTPMKDLPNKELIELLTHEDFNTRQEVTEIIWRKGKSILADLQSITGSRNPELAARSAEIIRYIKFGISPDTPPQIAELVKSFETADKSLKEEILRELYVERECSLMLFMLSEMEDQQLALELHKDYRRLAHEAARESIAMGEVDRAIEQLKLSPNYDVAFRSLAYIYSRTGKLDEEIKKLKNAPDNRVNKMLNRALYMAKENRSEIRKFAEQENLFGVIESLDLLDGNPSLMIASLSDDVPFIAKSGLEILNTQFSGENQKLIDDLYEDQLTKLKLFKGSVPTDLTNQIFKSMALTGGVKHIEPYIEENFEEGAFSYFTYQEQPVRALQVLGITDEESLAKYVKEHTDLAVKSQLEEEKKDPFGEMIITNDHRDQLLTLTEFYYDRGLYDTAKKIITPLIEAFEKQKNTEWNKLVETLSHRRMHDLSVDFIIEKSKKNDGDKEVYNTMVSYLYDDTLHTELVWSTLLDRDEVSAEQSFRDLAIIMGVEQEKLPSYLKLQNDLLKIAKRKGVLSLKEMREALLSVAMYRQDALSEVKFSKQLLDADKNTDDESVLIARKGDYLRALVGTVDSKTLVEVLDANRSIIDDARDRSARWYAIYSIAKRRLGAEDEADELLDHAKMLSLGTFDDLRQIAAEHYFAGYFEYSTEIMERALIAASLQPSSQAFRSILSYLSLGDNGYIHTKQWGKAAAFLMVGAVQDMIADPDGNEVNYISGYLSSFYNLNFTRGMELYQKGEKAKGLEMLHAAHSAVVGNGSLADHFYPAIRSLDLEKQYDLWVEESYQHTKLSIDAFPKCANTHNTMAWILSRAVRKLDEALEHSKLSHELQPNEAAYIDTMAEVWHAKGNRKKAVEWGEKAVEISMYGRLNPFGRPGAVKLRTYNLYCQLERFRTGAHPKP